MAQHVSTDVMGQQRRGGYADDRRGGCEQALSKVSIDKISGQKGYRIDEQRARRNEYQARQNEQQRPYGNCSGHTRYKCQYNQDAEINNDPERHKRARIAVLRNRRLI
jgi:hypothetical protein